MTPQEIRDLMTAEADLHSSDPMYGEPLEIGYGYTVAYHAKKCPYCEWKLGKSTNLAARVRPIQELPAHEKRVETGPIRFADDWPGVFIRGDNAILYALYMAKILDNDSDVLAKHYGAALLNLIKSSDMRLRDDR